MLLTNLNHSLHQVVTRYRPILNQTLFYGASIALMKGISLLMLPFIAHQLEPAEFGRLETLTTLAILCSIICAAGLEDTLYKHVGFAKTRAEKRQQAANIYGLSICLAGLTLILLPAIGQLAWRLLPGDIALLDIQLILLQVALEASIAVPLGWLRLKDKASLFFAFTAGRALVQALLTLALLHYMGGIRSILLAGLLTAALQAIGLGYYQLKSSGIALQPSLIRPATLYALPVIASGLVNFPLSGLDRWLIAAYSTEATLANVAIAAKFALAAVLLLQPFTMWWSPKRFTVLAGANGREQTLKWQMLGLGLLCLICLAVAFIAPLLMIELLPQQYHGAIAVMPYLLAVVFFKEACELVNIGCFSGARTQTQFTINACCAILCATLMWLSCVVCQWYAPDDANLVMIMVLVSLMIGQLIRLGLFFYYSQRAEPLNYPKWRLALAGSLTLATLFAIASLSSVSARAGIALILCLLLGFVWKLKKPLLWQPQVQNDA
ncbi:lipopolysaccharide biosynthesis protein [Motilimonas eburnea]|uniref:lipopolysaccharide biosynthesis protein n=1 Tax=Motilimonas eburnea TaxID=1737488 RepID=UPI001E4A7848|nr:oligosaccharide flippase family protein [Motilimonas eburnea]MCE2572042.1 oligosaccharide flippase family protein [Motilimonas eburnea]